MTIDLDAAQALCDAATAGPWKAVQGEQSLWFRQDYGDGLAIRLRGPNSEFIAAARTLVPELIAELRDQRELGTTAQRTVAIESGAWPDWCGETVGDVLAERDTLQARLDDVLALHPRASEAEATGVTGGFDSGYNTAIREARRAATGDA